MPKSLIISILLSSIFWACACASTDSCAEEWYGLTDRETVDRKNAKCVNQEKYDSCLSRHFNSLNSDVVAQCREEAMYLCKDRKMR